MKDGVLNIYKPQNMTSHDVVSIIRKALQTKKVGHTGTLDPMATGVLPICIGRATKIVDFIQADTKTYRAEITLGLTTDTEDVWGKTIETFAVDVTEDAFRTAILSFIGEIDQVPPMYSALKINGKKLYELAREGKTVERKVRKRTIYNIDIIRIEDNKALFDVTCSKGTYIRTLCADIGKQLGIGAIMSGLERIQSGPFTIESAITIEEVREKGLALEDDFMDVDKALGFKKRIDIRDKACELIRNGVQIDLMRYEKIPVVENDYVLVYHNDKFVALAQFNGEKLLVTKLFDIKRS